MTAPLPPEVAAAHDALTRSQRRPWWAPWRRWIPAQHLAEALGTVDYLLLTRRPPGGEG